MRKVCDHPFLGQLSSPTPPTQGIENPKLALKMRQKAVENCLFQKRLFRDANRAVLSALETTFVAPLSPQNAMHVVQSAQCKVCLVRIAMHRVHIARVWNAHCNAMPCWVSGAQLAGCRRECAGCRACSAHGAQSMSQFALHSTACMLHVVYHAYCPVHATHYPT